mgnify:CR=1 FL=1
MRLLTYILVLIFYGCAMRIPQSNTIKSVNPIIKFVDDNMGKRVENGLCYQLVKGAMINNSGDKAWWTHNYKWSVLFRHRVRMKNAVAGDMIDFSNVEMSDGVTAKSHVAIVYKVLDNGVFMIAEQNVNCSQKNSKVVLNRMDMRDLEKGKIKFYHFK